MIRTHGVRESVGMGQCEGRSEGRHFGHDSLAGEYGGKPRGRRRGRDPGCALHVTRCGHFRTTDDLFDGAFQVSSAALINQFENIGVGCGENALQELPRTSHDPLLHELHAHAYGIHGTLSLLDDSMNAHFLHLGALLPLEHDGVQLFIGEAASLPHAFTGVWEHGSEGFRGRQGV